MFLCSCWGHFLTNCLEFALFWLAAILDFCPNLPECNKQEVCWQPSWIQWQPFWIVYWGDLLVSLVKFHWRAFPSEKKKQKTNNNKITWLSLRIIFLIGNICTHTTPNTIIEDSLTGSVTSVYNLPASFSPSWKRGKKVCKWIFRNYPCHLCD